MFHLDVMKNRVAHFHKGVVTTPKVHTDGMSVIHIFFAVSMNPTGAISLKIWNQTVWTADLNVK